MKPKLVTFDVAGTLVELRQPLLACLHQAAEELDLSISRDHGSLFQAMYQARLPQFHAINLLRDPEQGAIFWRGLAGDWLERIGCEREMATPLQQAVDRATLNPNSSMFGLYDDTIPCLKRLTEQGVVLAAISNWDYTLHRVLDMLGIKDYFKVVVASLEEGFEKPDPRIFHLALDQCGFTPEESLHVGDHPIDDIEGATGLGMRAILIDRSGATGDAIRSLDRLEEHPAWTS